MFLVSRFVPKYRLRWFVNFHLTLWRKTSSLLTTLGACYLFLPTFGYFDPLRICSLIQLNLSDEPQHFRAGRGRARPSPDGSALLLALEQPPEPQPDPQPPASRAHAARSSCPSLSSRSGSRFPALISIQEPCLFQFTHERVITGLNLLGICEIAVPCLLLRMLLLALQAGNQERRSAISQTRGTLPDREGAQTLRAWMSFSHSGWFAGRVLGTGCSMWCCWDS